MLLFFFVCLFWGVSPKGALGPPGYSESTLKALSPKVLGEYPQPPGLPLGAQNGTLPVAARLPRRLATLPGSPESGSPGGYGSTGFVCVRSSAAKVLIKDNNTKRFSADVTVFSAAALQRFSASALKRLSSKLSAKAATAPARQPTPGRSGAGAPSARCQ